MVEIFLISRKFCFSAEIQGEGWVRFESFENLEESKPLPPDQMEPPDFWMLFPCLKFRVILSWLCCLHMQFDTQGSLSCLSFHHTFSGWLLCSFEHSCCSCLQLERCQLLYWFVSFCENYCWELRLIRYLTENIYLLKASYFLFSWHKDSCFHYIQNPHLWKTK